MPPAPAWIMLEVRPKFSVTHLTRFERECLRRTHYEIIAPLPFDSPAASIGTEFHARVADRYSQEYHCEVGVDESRPPHDPPSQEVKVLAADMTEFFWTNRRSVDAQLQEIVELEGRIELPQMTPSGEALVVGHFDMLYRDTMGRLWIRDWKTKGKLPTNYSWMFLDTQRAFYIAGIEAKYGESVFGFEHILVRREVPPGVGTRSERTASGRLSTASRNPRDYIRAERTLVPENALRRKAWLDAGTRLVERRLTEKEWVRQPGQNCAFCPYFAPCVREYEGETVGVEEFSQIASMLALSNSASSPQE